MKSPSLLEVVDTVGQRIPAGHTVRAIYGALENPTLPSIIPDATRVQSDKEVGALFDLTSSKPIRLQIVLHREPNQVPVVPDSPPPDDGPYFTLHFLNAAELYDGSAEYSNTIQRNLAGFTNRVFPKRDYAFEMHKMKIQKRMRRQARVLRQMKAKHRHKFPNTDMYDSDADKWDSLHIPNSQPQNGQEMVHARHAILAGLAGKQAAIAVMPVVNAATRAACHTVGVRIAQAAWDSGQG